MLSWVTFTPLRRGTSRRRVRHGFFVVARPGSSCLGPHHFARSHGVLQFLVLRVASRARVHHLLPFCGIGLFPATLQAVATYSFLTVLPEWALERLAPHASTARQSAAGHGPVSLESRRSRRVLRVARQYRQPNEPHWTDPDLRVWLATGARAGWVEAVGADARVAGPGHGRHRFRIQGQSGSDPPTSSPGSVSGSDGYDNLSACCSLDHVDAHSALRVMEDAVYAFVPARCPGQGRSSTARPSAADRVPGSWATCSARGIVPRCPLRRGIPELRGPRCGAVRCPLPA